VSLTGCPQRCGTSKRTQCSPRRTGART
jgi:hypothetical protein